MLRVIVSTHPTQLVPGKTYLIIHPETKAVMNAAKFKHVFLEHNYMFAGLTGDEIVIQEHMICKTVFDPTTHNFVGEE